MTTPPGRPVRVSEYSRSRWRVASCSLKVKSVWRDCEYYDDSRIEDQSERSHPLNIGDAQVRPIDDSDATGVLKTSTI